MEPWIVNATAFANKVGTSYGYSVLNGEEIPDELIKVIHLSEGKHEIILASDGYPAVKADLTAVRTGSGQTFKGRSPVLQIHMSLPRELKPGNKSFDDDVCKISGGDIVNGYYCTAIHGQHGSWFN